MEKRLSRFLQAPCRLLPFRDAPECLREFRNAVHQRPLDMLHASAPRTGVAAGTSDANPGRRHRGCGADLPRSFLEKVEKILHFNEIGQHGIMKRKSPDMRATAMSAVLEKSFPSRMPFLSFTQASHRFIGG
ncbi:MAG: hypothetical protein K6E40_01200 [Desulfovibrio sp.]|nr:hypothetical protein [Desulfovibrio sp.]